MNDSKPPAQRLLFEADPPRWNTLPKKAQRQLVEILSHLLLDALDRHDNASISEEITAEDTP